MLLSVGGDLRRSYFIMYLIDIMNGECPRWRSDPGGPNSASERWSELIIPPSISYALDGHTLSPSLSLPCGCCPEMRYVCSLKMGAIVFDYWSLPLSPTNERILPSPAAAKECVSNFPSSLELPYNTSRISTLRQQQYPFGKFCRNGSVHRL